MKNVIMTILVVLVLVMGGYLVYDKVLVKEEVNNNENESVNDVVIEQKDAAYFDEYLKAFLSCDGALYVTRNTENFSNKDISNFVSRYYNLIAYKDEFQTEYKANVVDVDALIYKYFNKNDVVLEANPNTVTTITKQDNIYIFNWEAVGCGSRIYKDSVVTYNGENVTVKYLEYDNLGAEYTGKTQTFYLKYNNGNYNVIKIEE